MLCAGLAELVKRHDRGDGSGGYHQNILDRGGPSPDWLHIDQRIGGSDAVRGQDVVDDALRA